MTLVELIDALCVVYFVVICTISTALLKIPNLQRIINLIPSGEYKNERLCLDKKCELLSARKIRSILTYGMCIYSAYIIEQFHWHNANACNTSTFTTLWFPYSK